jgi:type IV pilus assembly protein PilM
MQPVHHRMLHAPVPAIRLIEPARHSAIRRAALFFPGEHSLAFSIPHCFKPALLLGLDIDPTAIRMVELSHRPNRGFQLERYAQRALPEGAVSDQHIDHPGQLAEHIAAIARQLGSKRKRVALALPAHAVITRRMQVPATIAEHALNDLITAEAGAWLTVTPDQVRVDYQFCSIDTNDNVDGNVDNGIDDSTNRTGDPAQRPQRHIVLAAARREQVEDRIAAVEAAGLIPEVLDIDLYAAHAACVHASTVPAYSALLMPGASMTQIALFDRHQLLYRRELPGCSNAEGSDTLQIAIAATRAIQLATPTGMTLAHIFIGGDYTAPTQLAQAMQSQSNTRCSAAHPFSAMEMPEATAYLVACGLAMRRISRTRAAS